MSSEKKGSAWQTVLIVMLLAAAIGGITYAAIRFRPNGEPWKGGNGTVEGRFCQSSCPDCPTNVSLPPSSPLPIPKLNKDTPPWFITTNIEDAPRISIDQNTTAPTLRVDYAPCTWSTDSGADFKANPNNSLPSESAVLRYSVYFPPDFPWTKGGKLPGFCISDSVDGCATGSKWSNSSGSVRVMFRQEGRAIGYVYLPLQVAAGASREHDGIEAVSAVQGPEFQTVSNLPSYTLSGIDLWCKALGGLKFEAGEWNNVTVFVSMNDIGQANGELAVTVNDQTREINDIVWRIDKNVRINKLLFATFFGGNDPGWMIQEPTFSLFRNFSFAAPTQMPTAAPTAAAGLSI